MNELRSDSVRRRRKLKKEAKVGLVVVTLVIIFVFWAIHHIFESKKPSAHMPTSHAVSKRVPKEISIVKKTSDMHQDVSNDAAIDRYLNHLHFNGTALVIKNNKVIIDKGYGAANFANNIQNSANTVYYIASISKIFVSTSIMQLQEKGLLNINDPVSKYIPDFPYGNQIKLYHLLTHTSGIPEHSETAKSISHDELMKKIEKGHLRFAPGTGWLYSDSNYAILAYILEKVTHSTLQSYVQQHIFSPLKMYHSGFGDAFNEEPQPSTGYKLKHHKLVIPTLPDMSQLFGCGDIYTTAYDMYLFDKGLYNGKLLSSNSLTKIFTPVRHDYGFGMYHNPGSYSDHGVLPGWNTLNSFNLTGNKFVILFTNVQNKIKSLGVVDNHIYGLLRNK